VHIVACHVGTRCCCDIKAVCCVVGPAGAPRDVQIVSNGSSAAAVCWQLPNRSEWNGYLRGCVVHYRSLKPTMSPFTAVNMTDITQPCIVIDELQPSGEYEVSISCFNAACLGPFSDGLQFTVNDDVLETPPTSVSAVPVNSTSIQVSFLPPQFTERSDLYYVITATRTVTSNVTSQVIDDERISAGTVAVHGRLFNDSKHSDYVDGLDKFSEYYVTVQCVTDNAAGPVSSAVTVRTLDDGMYVLPLHILHEQKFA